MKHPVAQLRGVPAIEVALARGDPVRLVLIPGRNASAPALALAAKARQGGIEVRKIGATALLLPGRPTPAAVFEILGRHQPTIFYGVPTLYAALLADPACAEAAGSARLRACVSAGEPLPATIFERWRDQTGLTILDGIGTTEILHIFIANSLEAHKPGASGALVPGYEARIVDDDDKPVPTGKIG